MSEAVDEKTSAHMNERDWSDIPPQEYLSRFRVGNGWPAIEAETEIHSPGRAGVSITLPPWLWDEVDWDGENTYTHTGSRHGTKVLGPEVPPGARYRVEKACKRAQLRVEARRETNSIGMEGLKGYADDALDDLEASVGMLARRGWDPDEVEKVTAEDVAEQLRRVEEAVRAMRVWVYEELGVA